MTLIETIRRGATTAKWAGVLLIIAGALAVAAPLAAGISVSLMVGVLMVIGGLTRIYIAFRAGIADGWMLGLVGALTAAAGGYLVARPGAALLSLTLALALYFVFVGVVEVLGALGARPADGWGSLLFGGALSIVLGVMIWRQFPLSGAWAIGTLVGVRMMWTGWTFVSVAGAVKRASEAGGAG